MRLICLRRWGDQTDCPYFKWGVTFSVMCSSNVNSLSMMMPKSLSWKTCSNSIPFSKSLWACLMLLSFSRVKTWHLLGWNFNSQTFDQFSRLLISSWSWRESSRFLMDLATLVSSANRNKLDRTLWQIVDINDEKQWSQYTSLGYSALDLSWFRLLIV